MNNGVAADLAFLEQRCDARNGFSKKLRSERRRKWLLVPKKGVGVAG